MIKEIRDDLELILLAPTVSFEALRKVDGEEAVLYIWLEGLPKTLVVPVKTTNEKEVCELVLNLRANYKQHCINALAKLSRSFNQPHFIFKVDTGDGRVLISDNGELTQYANIYEFNWFYGTPDQPPALKLNMFTSRS